MQPTLSGLKQDMARLADPMRAKVSQSFFKTGAGQYGHGDVFIGLTVPNQRKLAKKYRDLRDGDVLQLLQSKIHEQRLIAIFILVDHFKKGDQNTKEKIYKLYLSHTKWINNWDLVDSSASYIVGQFQFGKPIKTQLALAKSHSLWEKRIAIISTLYNIVQGNPEKTLVLAKVLLKDKHDLIHKAVGWMLREVGKRCSTAVLEGFLDEHAHDMPRTMLRYAIERLSPEDRRHYLNFDKKKVGSSAARTHEIGQ